MKRFSLTTLALCLALSMTVLGAEEKALDTTKANAKDSGATTDKEVVYITTKSGLKYHDIVIGTGEEAKAGMKVQVYYTGWLSENGKKGRIFDTTTDDNVPLVFTLGMREVIQGWEEGIAGMKAGGKRTLIIAPELGFGNRDINHGQIPPNSTLIFEVEFIESQKVK